MYVYVYMCVSIYMDRCEHVCEGYPCLSLTFLSQNLSLKLKLTDSVRLAGQLILRIIHLVSTQPLGSHPSSARTAMPHAAMPGVTQVLGIQLLN